MNKNKCKETLKDEYFKKEKHKLNVDKRVINKTQVN